MDVENGIQLDPMGTLKRRGKLAAGVVGGVFLVAYWIAMALPNEYTSTATIFVEPQAISEQLIQAGTGQSDLNRRLALMSAQILSRPRLSRVIDELSLYRDESEWMLREEVIELMRSEISIQPVIPELSAEPVRGREEEINTFTVSFRYESSQKAAAVAQRLANDFIKEHIEERVQMTQKSLEFIDAEQARLSARIAEVEQKISEIKGQNAGRLPEDLFTNQRQLERSLSDLRAAERQLDLARGEAAFWENQSLTAAAASGIGGAEGPLQRLRVLEMQLSEHRSRGYTDKHPDVVQVRQEIEELRGDMDVNQEEDAKASAGVSLAEQNAAASNRRAQMDVTASQQEIARLRAQVDEVSTRIEQTPQVSAQLESLVRRQEQLAESLNDYTSRRQQAAVHVDLERRQLGEQFRILESAFADPEPSAPNRILILILGLMMGLALGAGVAVLAEGADASYHDSRTAQNDLGIPVLASIPRILLEPDRVAARRRVLRTALAVGVLVIFNLGAGAATYLYVNGAPRVIRGLMPSTDDAARPAAEGRASGGGRL